MLALYYSGRKYFTKSSVVTVSTQSDLLRPMIQSLRLAAQPGLKQIAIFAEVVQQAGERGFLCALPSFQEFLRAL